MPGSCFVPACNSGYKSCKEKRHLFLAPKDANLLKVWQKAILRADKVLTPQCHVCELHFEDHFIIKCDKFVIDGKQVSLPRQCWKLTKDAVPSRFKNLSKKSRPSKRKPPATRLTPPEEKTKISDDSDARRSQVPVSVLVDIQDEIVDVTAGTSHCKNNLSQKISKRKPPAPRLTPPKKKAKTSDAVLSQYENLPAYCSKKMSKRKPPATRPTPPKKKAKTSDASISKVPVSVPVEIQDEIVEVTAGTCQCKNSLSLEDLSFTQVTLPSTEWNVHYSKEDGCFRISAVQIKINSPTGKGLSVLKAVLLNSGFAAEVYVGDKICRPGLIGTKGLYDDDLHVTSASDFQALLSKVHSLQVCSGVHNHQYTTDDADAYFLLNGNAHSQKCSLLMEEHGLCFLCKLLKNRIQVAQMRKQPRPWKRKSCKNRHLVEKLKSCETQANNLQSTIHEKKMSATSQEAEEESLQPEEHLPVDRVTILCLCSSLG